MKGIYILGIAEKISYNLGKAISSVLYTIIWLLFKITHYIEKAVMAIAGVLPLGTIVDKTGIEKNAFITDLINISDDPMAKYIRIMYVISCVIMMIIIFTTLIKSHIQGNSAEKTKDIMKYGGLAIVLVFVLPTALVLVIKYTNLLLYQGYQVLNGGSSATETIFKSMFKPLYYSNGEWIEDASQNLWKVYSGWISKGTLDKVNPQLGMEHNLNWAAMTGNKEKGLIEAISDENIIAFDYGTYGENFLMIGKGTGFNYLVSIICVVALVYNFFMIAIPTVSRLIVLLSSVAIASPVAATTVTGDKQRFEEWSKTFVANLLSVIGTVLSVIFFGIIVKLAMSTIDKLNDQHSFMKMIYKLLITVCAAIGMLDIKKTLDQIITNGTGVNVKGGGLGAMLATAAGFGGAVKGLVNKNKDKDQSKKDKNNSKSNNDKKDSGGGSGNNKGSGKYEDNKKGNASRNSIESKMQNNNSIDKAVQGGDIKSNTKPGSAQEGKFDNNNINNNNNSAQQKADNKQIDTKDFAKKKDLDKEKQERKEKDQEQKADSMYKDGMNTMKHSAAEQALKQQKTEMKKQVVETKKLSEKVKEFDNSKD